MRFDGGECKVCSRDTCRHGGQPQPIANFRRDPRWRAGYRSECRDCEGLSARERYWQNKAPCVRCRERRRQPWSKLCAVCDPARRF